MSNLFLYVLAVSVWGSTWYVIEFQYGVVAIEVSLAYRNAIAAALAFALCRMRGQTLAFGLRAHARFAALGVLLFGLNYFAAYHAQLYIGSAMNAICFSAMVWMNIVNARIFFGAPITLKTATGATLGMAGIVIIFWPSVESISLSDGVLFGAGLSLLGAILASLGNMVSQATHHDRIPVMPGAAWGMFYGALLYAAIAIVRGQPFNYDPAPSYTLSLLFLAVIGSVLAFAAYLTLLGRIGAARAGYVVVMIPVVALVISILFEDLHLTGNILAGATLAVAGNAFILARK